MNHLVRMVLRGIAVKCTAAIFFAMWRIIIYNFPYVPNLKQSLKKYRTRPSIITLHLFLSFSYLCAKTCRVNVH